MKTKLLMVAAALLFSATAYAQDPQAPGDLSAASTNCTYNFGGGDLKWCVSENGNIMKFESPSTFEHIRVGGFYEGYVLCTAGFGPYYDDGGGFVAPSGWGAPTILAGPTGSGVTIQRVTTDGRFRLVQKFSRDTVERDITVQGTLYNQSGAAIGGIRLLRVVDLDVDNVIVNAVHDRSADGVWARQTHAVSLTGITLKYPRVTWINSSVSPIFDGNPCNGTPVTAPSVNADRGQVVGYDIGTLAAGKNAAVKWVYRAQ